jgi:hypothetical protein
MAQRPSAPAGVFRARVFRCPEVSGSPRHGRSFVPALILASGLVLVYHAPDVLHDGERVLQRLRGSIESRSRAHRIAWPVYLDDGCVWLNAWTLPDTLRAPGHSVSRFGSGKALTSGHPTRAQAIPPDTMAQRPSARAGHWGPPIRRLPQGAAHSMAALGMLAPFYESRFFQDGHFRTSYARQVIPYQDSDLGKLYVFLRHLGGKLPRRRGCDVWYHEQPGRSSQPAGTTLIARGFGKF